MRWVLAEKRTLFAALALSAVGVFGFSQTSYAFLGFSMNTVSEGILAILGSAVGFVSYYISNLIEFIITWLLRFEGYLIDLGMNLNQHVISPGGIVAVGWQATRDVANLAFTIGIIAIAFATILRSQQYGAKKLLGKLIIVALLINFSLLIPGVILDGTHVFSNFFISKINPTQNGENAIAAVSESMASAFGIQKLTGSPLEGWKVDNLAQVFQMIANVVFIALFGALTSITFGAVAYMVFYRYFMMTFLFIIAPLAWISLFLPGLAKHWSEWWDAFFRWALFLPGMTFFIYLSIYMTTAAGGLKTLVSATGTSAYGTDTFVGTFATFGQMIVVLGIMVGGLIVAQKFGIAGAGAAIGMATGVKNFAIGKTKGAVVGTATYLGARPVKAGAMGLASLLNRPLIRAIPGMKGAIAGLNQFGQRQEEIDAYRKQYLSKKALSNDEFVKILKGRMPEDPVAKAAILAEAASRGLLKEIKDDPKKLIALADAAKEANPGTEAKDVKDIQAILGTNASLAPQITKGKLTPYEAARRFITADKAHEQSEEELAKPSIVAAFGQGHFKDLVENPGTSAGQLITVQSTVEKLAGKELVQLYQDYAIAQLEIDRAKEEGVPENDVFALDDKGRKIKGADGQFVIAQKGLKTLKREKKVELNKRRDELFRNPSTVTDEDRAIYADVIKNKRLNDPRFIENFEKEFKHKPSDEELILGERGKAYKQLEDMKKQVGSLFYRPYDPKAGGGGGGAGPTQPPTGGGPTGPVGSPTGGPGGAPSGGAPGEGPIPLTGAGGGIIPPQPTGPVELTPPRRTPKQDEIEQGIAQRAEEIRRRREQTATKSATAEAARVATEAARVASEGTPPPPPVGSRTEPRTVNELRTRAEEAGGGAAPAGTPPPFPKEKEQGRDEAERRAQQEREASAKRVREEAERTAEANRESAKSEEQRRAAAEKIDEAAGKEAKAVKEKLNALEAALGVTKKTEEETKKILREVEGGTEAAKKTTEELKKQADLTILTLKKAADFRELLSGETKEWVGRTIVTPDESRRVITNIVRNNVNPDESLVVMDTMRKGETTSHEDQLTLRQLYNFTEKGLKGVKILRK